MKKIFMILAIVIAATTITFGQKKMAMPAGNSVDAQLIAFEKKGWET